MSLDYIGRRQPGAGEALARSRIASIIRFASISDRPLFCLTRWLTRNEQSELSLANSRATSASAFGIV